MEKLGKKQKILLYSGVITLVVVLAVIVYRRLKEDKGYTETLPADIARYNCTNTKVATFPLKKGSNGYQVELLQRISNTISIANFKIATDGIWGNDTQKAFAENFGKVSFTEDEYKLYIKDYNENPTY